MAQAAKKTVVRSLLGCGGMLLLILAAQALYLGFLSPMNRGRGMGGGAFLLALVFGVPGAYLLYRASKATKNGSQNGSEGSSHG